jgi:hypothetical protein
MIRFSSPFEALLLATLVPLGCNRTHALKFDTAPLASESPRQAPGIAVDPAPALPSPQRQTTLDSGLVVLQAPASSEGDEAVVQRFFEAVTDRDAEKLAKLLDSDAKTKTSAKATEMDALDFWKSRLARLDYSKLAGQSVYRRHSVEIYRTEDIRQLGAERSLPVEVRPQQVAVRVPLHSPQSDKVRLFGNEIVFLLTPTEHGLRIAEIVEDFQLP